jgi:hypothetical protein
MCLCCELGDAGTSRVLTQAGFAFLGNSTFIGNEVCLFLGRPTQLVSRLRTMRRAHRSRTDDVPSV